MKFINALYERFYARRYRDACPRTAWDHYYSMEPAGLVAMIGNGDGKAAFVLGDIYDAGLNGVERDLDKALQLYRLGETRNDPDALNNIGSMHHHGDRLPVDLTTARQYYERGVAGGCAASFNNLGRMYLNGDGGLVADAKRGIELLVRGADLNDANAALKLAGLHRDGEHVKRSAAKRIYWLWRAAHNGSAVPYEILGDMYAAGDEDLPRNTKRAVWLFREGAAQCSPHCFLMLGIAHYSGQGTPKDPLESWKFLTAAKSAGEDSAGAYLEKLRAQNPGTAFPDTEAGA